jgi:glucoamylase
MEGLDDWLERQTARAATGMLMSVSPVEIVKTRPGFGQTVRPRRGAIVASPVPAAYDPDPDYFFHWFRDSAIVVDALRLLYVSGRIGAEALAHLADFVAFSLALQDLDGAALAADAAWRRRVEPGFVQYLRTDGELEAVRGAQVAAESRVNADGTLDFTRWSRPQHDGPPLRALALLRWLGSGAPSGPVSQSIGALLWSDLDFTLRRWHEPSFDIWEEEQGLHYYNLRVSAAALAGGAVWLAGRGEPAAAAACREQARLAGARLEAYWLEDEGFLRSRAPAQGLRSAKELDIAVILAALHAGGADGSGAADGWTHLRDPRLHATLARLERHFDAEYPINRGRGAGRGPALGRYPGDVYYSGGAYYFSTLGAAEFCFRAARAGAAGEDWFARGDAYLGTVRAFTPAGGELSEQFDRSSGAQTSARHLAWSYAALISCAAARHAAAGRA